MGQTIYTSTAQIFLYIVFSCSKCHTLNVGPHLIREHSRITTAGLHYNAGTSAYTTSMAHDKAMLHLNSVNNSQVYRSYRKADLHNSCEKCHHKEPWAKYRTAKYIPWIAILLVGLLSIVVAVTVSPDTFDLKYLWIALGIFLVLWFALFKERYLAHLDDQVRALPKECLPILAPEKEDAINIYNQINGRYKPSYSGASKQQQNIQSSSHVSVEQQDQVKAKSNSVVNSPVDNAKPMTHEQEAQETARRVMATPNKATTFNPDTKKQETVSTLIIDYGDKRIPPKVKQAFLFIEDSEWDKANAYIEDALDADPTNPYAYLGKLMVDLRTATTSQLRIHASKLGENNYYQKAVRFADEELKKKLKAFCG